MLFQECSARCMVLSVSSGARLQAGCEALDFTYLTLSSVKQGQWQLGAQVDITKCFLVLALTAIVLGTGDLGLCQEESVSQLGPESQPGPEILSTLDTCGRPGVQACDPL